MSARQLRYLRLKNFVERVMGALVLVAAAPLLVALMVVIRVRLGRGVIYTQQRIGRGGEPFTIYKFRTMEPDRRSAQASAVDPARDRRRTHKTSHDPRHTGVGRLLRRTSLDELPQLWNVVRGEMVLVGPRPELETVVDAHQLRDHVRHCVKPGITGQWQVSEHREELLHENLHIDVDYVRSLSPGRDLSILLKTLAMPFTGSGS